jgi:hypothetical protein
MNRGFEFLKRTASLRGVRGEGSRIEEETSSAEVEEIAERSHGWGLIQMAMGF